MPRKKDKNVRKPKRAMNAYCIFLKEMKGKDAVKNLTFTQFTRLCAEKWASMTQEQKQYFRDKAAADKRRYKHEVKYFGPSKRKKSTDKKPMSPFFYFCQVFRPKLKAKYPTWKLTEVAQELGKLWKAASPSVKVKYKGLAKKSWDNYQRIKEMKEEREIQKKKVPKPATATTSGDDSD